MKILKILLILLIPAMGIVGCQKSGLKPSCPATPTAAAKITDSGDGQVNNARLMSPIGDEDQSGELVGSGDDDRDGGDKKRKK